jgi:hypothetical protein
VVVGASVVAGTDVVVTTVVSGAVLLDADVDCSPPLHPETATARRRADPSARSAREEQGRRRNTRSESAANRRADVVSLPS